MNKFVITVSREYGSGGRTVGRQVAKELGIAFYDKELITLTAQESGLPQETVQEWAEKKTDSLLYDAYIAAQAKPLADEIYFAKSAVIREAAENGPCVIVGSCADYVLRNLEHCLRVFIYAPMEERVKRVKEEYQNTQSNIAGYIKKRDKQRSGYYNSYAAGNWGERTNYDLMVNSTIGTHNVVKIIKAASLNLFGGDVDGK